MQDSALFGHPPLNQRDLDILLGLFGSKDKLPKPAIISPDQPHSLASQLLIGCGFAIALVIIITGARLTTRIWRKEQVFGLDDWVIIPAAVWQNEQRAG